MIVWAMFFSETMLLLDHSSLCLTKITRWLESGWSEERLKELELYDLGGREGRKNCMIWRNESR